MDNDFSLEHSNGIYIPHLSASTINSFITNRTQFYASKVLRQPFQGNRYTARGTAVEHAVNVWLENHDHPNPIQAALDKFDEEIKSAGLSSLDPDVSEVRDSIPGLAGLALQFYQGQFSQVKPVPQTKETCKVDGVNREFLMYFDFLVPNNCVRDCKCVSKTPSKLSQSYILQGSLYRHATGLKNVVFDFFVANKKPVQKSIALTDDEFVHGMSYLTRAAQVLEEMEECVSPSRVMELMSFPDLSSFYSHEEKKAAAERWNIRL